MDDGGLTASSTITITYRRHRHHRPNSAPIVPDTNVTVRGGQHVVHLDRGGHRCRWRPRRRLICKAPTGFIVFVTDDPDSSDPTQTSFDLDIGLPPEDFGISGTHPMHGDRSSTAHRDTGTHDAHERLTDAIVLALPVSAEVTACDGAASGC